MCCVVSKNNVGSSNFADVMADRVIVQFLKQ